MAKTTSQWYDILVAEKQSFSSLNELQPSIDSSQTLLNDVSTTSKVSRWRLFLWVVAYCLWMLETIIERLAAATESGTPHWYRRKALDFQYGDALEIINNTPQYPTINPANQIVKLAAVVVNGSGEVILKVSKLDAGGEPEPLEPATEKAAFTEYLDTIKFAGTLTSVISQIADDLKCAYEVVFDPLVLNPDGSLITDSAIFPVRVAINSYLKNLPYNGMLHVDKLDDAVQSATGVVQAIRTSVHAKRHYEAPGSYVDVTAAPLQRYNPEAGYLRVSTEAGETLEDLIQYTPA